MKNFIISLFFIITFLLFSCSSDFCEKKLYIHSEKEWNYLIYMAADNNLERYAISNVKELQRNGSNEHVNYIVLLDRSSGYDKSEGNWCDTKLMYITKNPKSFNDDVVLNCGELDMTDSRSLEYFLNLVEQYFPARHTILNLWSHGKGVYPDGKIINERSIIEDYSTGYGSYDTMSIFDLHKELYNFVEKTRKKIDILQFDACDMQMLEIAYEVKDSVDYILGAETELPGAGADYYCISSFLNNNYLQKSSELCKNFCDFFENKYSNSKYEYVYSAFEMSSLSCFLQEINEFIACVNNFDEDECFKMNYVRKLINPVVLSYPEYVDIGRFIIDLDYQRKEFFIESLKKFVFISKNSKLYDGYYGISINCPYTTDLLDYYIAYEENEIISLYKDVDWMVVINKIINHF